MVTSQAEKLAELFSRIDKKISMDEFDDRLQVQKTTYLAQKHGLNLEYLFAWDIRGPYCKQVSENAHDILDGKVTASPTENSLDNEKLEKYKMFITPHLNDSDWLEIASSLVYLKTKTYSGEQLNDIVGYLIEDLTVGLKNFDEDLVRDIILDLDKANLLNN